MMSKIGIRGLVIFLGLLMVVCLGVLQLKSLSDLHKLGLKVAAMNQKQEMTIDKSMDKSRSSRKMDIDATEYDETDIDKLQERRRRSVDDLELAGVNSTLFKNYQPVYTPSGTGGAVYTRWGRTTCPDDLDTEIVYSGISGGSLYNQTGAAVNTLCLPNEPIWSSSYSDSLQGYAFMYGVEYSDQPFFKKTNAEAILNHNMPCVVCRSKVRTSTFMLPARNRCFGDWHLEYHGYLMTGYNVHPASTDYICVDEAPEADPSGFRAEYGRLLFRVEAICGSLPCPKYVNGRELTCSICSK